MMPTKEPKRGKPSGDVETCPRCQRNWDDHTFKPLNDINKKPECPPPGRLLDDP
jgi:hypothetical protein